MDDHAGFDKGWVAMTELNTAIAAEGTQEKMDEVEAQFKDGTLKATDVFKGPYTATNSDGDTIDLKDGYDENATQSAPSFSYVIDDIITVKGKLIFCMYRRSRNISGPACDVPFFVSGVQ